MPAPRAATSAEALDPRLRGRTYAVPFHRVWEACIALAGGELRGWRIVRADDYDGEIQAEVRRVVTRKVEDVTIRVSLDPDAQTRVDAVSASRAGWVDFRRNARRLRRFFRVLDLRVAGRRR